MNSEFIYNSLLIKGSDLEREILTSFLENFYLGVLNLEDSTLLYFKDVDKKKIEKIIIVNSRIDNWLWSEVEQEDWSENWKPFFKDIYIDDKIIIVPEWKNISDDKKTIIKIDPGMAFGTGHHETTELMIRFMLKYHKNNMDVLDLGTGSGILSIIAHKLISRKILSIDNDLNVSSNFKTNMLINNVDLNFKAMDCFDVKDFNYDIVLANINKNILIDLLPLMIAKKEFIIISGILESDYDEIVDVINRFNYNIIDYNKINDWIGFVIN